MLADDLTGALEVGALFAGSVVCVGDRVDADVVVLDLETRQLDGAEAAARVRAAVRGFDGELIYKKTDSTLRGNIGAELAALPEGRIHYAPAYPRMGRTVRAGRLYVNGVAVEATAFAFDPTQPVRDGDVRKVAGAAERVAVHDGETEEDVRAVAKTVMGEPCVRLAAGPAALAGALAVRMGLSAGTVERPVVRECFVVNGSLHPASAAQVRYAEERGMRGWRMAAIGEAWHAPGALVVFGGDTAREVLRGFGDPVLHPLGEVMAGVPVSWFEHAGRRWTLVTKAGGFGGEDLLTRLREMLDEGGAQ